MNLSYQTKRLFVWQVESVDVEETFLSSIPRVLRPRVVSALPPYFSDINTSEDARTWISQVLNESMLLAVRLEKSSELVGFILLYPDGEQNLRIGYLLAEDCWGQGFAGEMLTSLITVLAECGDWSRLVGGVEKDNIPSIRLLEKLGFVLTEETPDGVKIYSHDLKDSK